MSDDQKVIVDRIDMEAGWVVFQPDKDNSPSPEQTPGLLNTTFCRWLANNPEFNVRDTLAIVQDGNTVAIHVWFD